MILTTREKFITEGTHKFSVGDKIIATESDYAGLKGYITEIRTGKDKETENVTDDIYCCFEIPENNTEIELLEEYFSDLYGEPKTIDELCFDCVIMAPEEIRVIDDDN